MFKLIEIVAKIELFSGPKVRQSPFASGYRPLFDFEGEKTKISGKITLTDTDKFFPGTIGIVRITFIKGIIRDTCFTKGKVFSFGEGLDAFGKGEILEVLSM